MSAAFDHLSTIIGEAGMRDFSLDLDALHPGHFDLSKLEIAFSEDKTSAAAKFFPGGKAPVPEGFTSKFLHASWDDIFFLRSYF